MKPLVWIASSKKDLLAMPKEVKDTFGYALHLAQIGNKHERAKPLKRRGSAGILEVVENWKGDTYRAVYTVQLRIHGSIEERGLCPALLPEESDQRDRNAATGYYSHRTPPDGGRGY